MYSQVSILVFRLSFTNFFSTHLWSVLGKETSNEFDISHLRVKKLVSLIVESMSLDSWQCGPDSTSPWHVCDSVISVRNHLQLQLSQQLNSPIILLLSVTTLAFHNIVVEEWSWTKTTRPATCRPAVSVIAFDIFNLSWLCNNVIHDIQMLASIW